MYAGEETPPDDRTARASRLSVRLRPEDEILLHERAAARRMRVATYVSVLTRAHLRSLAPLPKEELLTLKRTVSELGGIGRNLNQIARAMHQGDRATGPGHDDLKAFLRVCGALRDHVKELREWETMETVIDPTARHPDLGAVNTVATPRLKVNTGLFSC